jgi:asparagine synthetase B (glutamine-hydrolysing)
VPGITGIISKISKAGAAQADVERMTRCMVHEPSYVSGTYVNKDVGLCAGWVSHGGSFSGCMPLWNERRDVCLIFSGEDFMGVEEVLRCGGRGSLNQGCAVPDSALRGHGAAVHREAERIGKRRV